MRSLFLDTVDFSRHCLQTLLQNGAEVTAVLTLARENANFNSDYADLSDIAEKYGVTLCRIKNINHPENVQLIKTLNPDVIFVFGWSQLISKPILDIPPLGCIGSHPALLPRDRGRHPIIWALVDGFDQSGLTFFFMDEGADGGDILWQRPFSITLWDDAGSIYKKIKELASQAIVEFLPQLENGTALRLPQDHELATYPRKRGKKDGEIVWSAPTMQIYNLVRALTHPYVGAHTFLDGCQVKVWRSALPKSSLPPNQQDAAPGTVIAVKNGCLDVRTADGFITISAYEINSNGTIGVGSQLGAT